MYIPRIALNLLKSYATKGKVVVIYGPRRVGKTTLLNKYLESEKNYLLVAGEDIFVKDYLSSQSVDKLKSFIGNKDLLVIDEAQYISKIGINLKLIVDHIPNVRVIATGSSTFDLAKQIGEPLTGRKNVIKMYSISQIELNKIENLSQVQANLENRIIYGSYPEVLTLENNDLRQRYLHELMSSNLLKDILAFEGIQKSKKIIDLLTLMALEMLL